MRKTEAENVKLKEEMKALKQGRELPSSKTNVFGTTDAEDDKKTKWASRTSLKCKLALLQSEVRWLTECCWSFLGQKRFL